MATGCYSTAGQAVAGLVGQGYREASWAGLWGASWAGLRGRTRCVGLHWGATWAGLQRGQIDRAPGG